jgi:hypothetical protein
MSELNERIEKIIKQSYNNMYEEISQLVDEKADKCNDCDYNIEDTIQCSYHKDTGNFCINRSKWKKRKPKKSNEELVFELIKDDLIFFKEEITTLTILKANVINSLNNIYRKLLFTIIMKGVHELIEGNNTEKNLFISYDELDKKYVITIVNGEIFIPTTNPSFFYFSTHKNAEKARDILSNFFEDENGESTNLLDWWYKS